MKRAAPIMLSLALAAGGLSADDRALLIGIGKYRIAEANLPGVAEDLAMMREVARTLGFAEAQVKVLADSEASLQGIRDAIANWLVEGTTAGDRVLFYHSGHGSRIPDLSGDEADGSDEVLLPYDFQEVSLPGDGRDQATAGADDMLLRNILLDDELGRLLARIPAREVVALVDSCHSGTMTRSLGEKSQDGNWTSKFYRYQGIPRGGRGSFADRALERRDSIVLLSAARPEEEAQTSVHGALFTRGVWRAVRAAQPRKQLTLDQLENATKTYIRQEVGDRTELLHSPMLTGYSGLRSINLFLPEGGSRVDETRIGETGVDPTHVHQARTEETPVEETRVDGPPGIPSDLWHQLEALVDGAGQSLDVTASQAVYDIGESLELFVVAPSDGYLHIFNIGAGEDELVLLYPNRYQTDNRLGRGETVQIPSLSASPRELGQAFTLPARLPSDRVRQKNLVVAIQTSQPLFSVDQPPENPQELFRIIHRGELTRSIRRGALATPAYAAGRVVVTIGL